MSVLQYQGRRVDVAAYHGTTLYGVQQLSQQLGNASGQGEVCTGIIKLAQRFYLELFTERGSMPLLPDRGCEFMTEARRGQLHNPLQVLAAFSRAVVVIRRNMSKEDSSTDPADERLNSAILERLEYTPGHVTLHIAITSQADSAPAILPVSVAIA